MFRHSHNCPYFQSGDEMSDLKIYERSVGKALYCNWEVFTFLFGYMGISAFSSRLAVARRLFPYMRTYAFGSRLLLQLGGFYFFSRVLCGYSFLVGISLAYFFGGFLERSQVTWFGSFGEEGLLSRRFRL